MLELVPAAAGAVDDGVLPSVLATDVAPIPAVLAADADEGLVSDALEPIAIDF